MPLLPTVLPGVLRRLSWVSRHETYNHIARLIVDYCLPKWNSQGVQFIRLPLSWGSRSRDLTAPRQKPNLTNCNEGLNWAKAFTNRNDPNVARYIRENMSPDELLLGKQTGAVIPSDTVITLADREPPINPSTYRDPRLEHVLLNKRRHRSLHR